MGLLKLQSAAAQSVVDDCLSKCMSKTITLIREDTALFSILLEDEDLSPLKLTSAVAIGLLGSVLSHPECDDELKRKILTELMGVISHAEEARRRGG